MTRENWFDKLVHALQETNQTGALGILNCGKYCHTELNALKQLNLDEKCARVLEIVKNEDLRIIKGVLEGIATELKIIEDWRKEEKSILHVAVTRGDYDVVEYLVNNQGFDIALSKLRFEDTLVHDCIKDINEIDADAFTQKCRILELIFKKAPHLIESRGDFNYRRTPLHVAAKLEFRNGKQVDFIEMLLRHNAYVNAKDTYQGNTPLHLLFYVTWNRLVPGNAVEIMRLLITHNADLDSLNNKGETFLHYAAISASPSLFNEVVEYLVSINKTNSFPIRDKEGYTILHYAVKYMKGDPLSETLEIFKTHRVDFNAIDPNGDSVMFNAIRHKRSEDFLNTLIRCEADWTITNKYQQTVLHLAADWRSLPALKLFISLDADVNAKDKNDNTPLHHALSTYPAVNHDIVKELVNNGADPTLKNNYPGLSPIDLAKELLKQGYIEQRTLKLLENAIPFRVL